MPRSVHRKNNRVLVTSGLPYSNGRIHVGHVAGAYLPADIYVRFLRLRGVETRFVCGSDDHGVTILLAAQKEGKHPSEIVGRYYPLQKKAFEDLGIHFDVYGSTSRNPHHAQASQDFFLEMHRKGFFEKVTTRQFCDEKRGIFLPDRFVKGTCGYCDTPDQNGDQCENCGKMLDAESLKDPRNAISGESVGLKDTVHWFLDLTRFEKQVSDWIESADLLRENTQTYVKSLLSTGLVKRSMTRDIDWGIPVPLDEPEAQGKVLYVWFDAPIGYISNTMQLCAEKDGSTEKYADWWKSKDCDIVHFIGEDNTIFHCVIWIAMLAAQGGGYQLPRGVIVNQFLNIQFPNQEEEKISKSRGAAVWIEDYVADGGNVDLLRYYLTSIAPERARTVYRPEELVQKNNADLGNTLGNLINRIFTFTQKYYGPTVPAYPEDRVGDLDREFVERLKKTHATLTELLEGCAFKESLFEVMEFARACNKYLDDKVPWSTRKTDEDATRLTLTHVIRAIHALGVWLAPFMPETSTRIRKMLSLPPLEMSESKPSRAVWDEALTPPKPGHALGTPEILFQRMDPPTGEGAAKK